MLEATSPVALSFGRSFVSSEAFRTMFREGMLLVEETAAYLDGAGREDSRSLPRDVSLAYATESMRLTTRLMQVASWLLVQRAVAEGEITQEQARNERNRVRISESAMTTSPALIEKLPLRLQELIDSSIRMQGRVLHLEGQINGELDAELPAPAARNAVASQLDMLKAAFPQA